MYRIHLRSQPHAVPAELVFRIAPDSSMGAKEAAVQRTVADMKYPTPAVRLVGGVDADLGGLWSVMDFARGSSPLDNLDGVAALRRAPGLFARLPRQLAESMSALHALDPDRVTAAVANDAPTVAWSVDDLLVHYEEAADVLGRGDLVVAIGALRRERMREGREVICHGDLHPFNLLVDEQDAVTVVDWTASVRAEPAYDIAFTALLLRNPPLAASGLLGVTVRFIGARLAGNFVARYRRLAPQHGLDQMRWYEALHGVRLLLQAETLEARDGPIDGGHPFAALVPAGTAALQTVTGTPIRTTAPN
jgi:aminoglycoside phosphotransferase (APT) family kinase protein